MKIRNAAIGDEESLLGLFTSLDEETDFMLFEPGERDTTVSEQADFLRNSSKVNNILLLVTEYDGEIIGFLGATGNKNNRNRHVLSFVTGVRKHYWGLGMGSALLKNLEVWAITNQYYRIEMTVRESNIRAINLYKSLGFIIEGVRHHSLKVDSEYVNELYMGKLIKV